MLAPCLAGLAVKLGLPDAAGADQQAAIDAARDWLERHDRWLVVFDNALGPDAIAELLVDAPAGHVVITSRAHADWRAVRAQPLNLNVWQRSESRAFLRERTGETDDGVLGAVAAALGDLPLALEQAAAYSVKRAITLSGYLERLRDRAPELLAAMGPGGYEHTVATVWQLAFEGVGEHLDARGLLGVCAHVAPERIPRELLEVAVGEGDGGDDGRRADDAIGSLLGYALLSATGDQTFGLHRLIAQLTRERSDSGQQARARAAAVGALLALWPERPSEHEQWPACRRLLARALAATEHSQRHATAPEQTAVLLGRVGQYPGVSAIGAGTGQSRCERGRTASRLARFRSCARRPA